MRSRILSIILMASFLPLSNIVHAEVYFAGWVNPSDDIDKYEEQGGPEPTRYEYGNFKIKRHKTRVKTISHSETFKSYSYLPNTIAAPGEKVVVVDPRVHAWGAYAANGKLIRSGLATAGGNWCSDIDRSCRTKTGSFRVYSLGGADCISTKYPIDEGGGAPMPYCMYFNGSQGLHGSYSVVAGNVSHGCVRLRVSDAEWLRYNFVNVGTKVIVKPY